MKTLIAVFASGTGSNFEVIADAVQSGSLDAQIVALVCDRVDAPVIAKAKARGIITLAVPVASGQTRAAHEEEILKQLLPHTPRFAVLAGYMRILSPVFLKEFDSGHGYFRVTNIHPSLLPAFPGVDGYGQAFNYGASVSGCTVHLVDQGIDSGPICAQSSFSISDCVIGDDVRSRGLTMEHRLYPETLQWLLKEKFAVVKREGRICVLPN